MKFSDFRQMNETTHQYKLYVDKSATEVSEDIHPWISKSYDDYMQYVDVIIKVEGNKTDYIALTVGANQADSEYVVIDKNIHVKKDNVELLSFIKLSDEEVEDLAREEAESVTS